jgi:soluble lytic murein transglycosylase-like protein
MCVSRSWWRCSLAAPSTRRPAAAQPVATSKSDPFEPFAAEAALRFGIPASWIKAIMQAESRGVVPAVSPKGVMG